MSFTLPHQQMEALKLMNKKLEACPIEQPLWPEPMTYFNNPKRRTSRNLYDTIVNQPPGYDQFSHRDDREQLSIIHENIFQQEKEKWIPVLASLQYGRPKLKFYDTMDIKHGKTNAIGSFSSRFGVNMTPDLDFLT